MGGSANDDEFEAALGAKDEIATARRDFDAAVDRILLWDFPRQVGYLREVLAFMHVYASTVRAHFGNGPIYEFAVRRIRVRVAEVLDVIAKQISAGELIADPKKAAVADSETRALALIMLAEYRASLEPPKH